jgi:hypothetical protein
VKVILNLFKQKQSQNKRNFLIMAKQSKYASYDEVPTYRKQWFFWLAYLSLTPAGVFILLFGDVYYVKNNQVESFGIANRIVAGILAIPYALFALSFLIGLVS